MRLLVARLISILANPLLLSFPAAYLLVYSSSYNSVYAFKWAITSLMAATIVAAFVILGVKKRAFSDFDVSAQKHRYLLFALVLSVLFLYLIFLFIFSDPKILVIATFAVILSIFILSIINNWVKASIHVATITAFSATLSIAFGGAYNLGLLLIFFAGWARIKTKRHTPFEVLFGAFLGALLTAIAYFVIKTTSL